MGNARQPRSWQANLARLLVLITSCVLAALAIGGAVRYTLGIYDLTGSPDRIDRVSAKLHGITHELNGAVGASRSWRSVGATVASLSFEARVVGQEQASGWEVLPGPTGTASSLVLRDGSLRVAGEPANNARTLIVLNTQLGQEEYKVRFRAKPDFSGAVIAGTVALSNQDGSKKASLNFRVAADETIEATWTPSEPLTTSVLVVTLSNLKGEGAIGPPQVTRSSSTLAPSQQMAIRAGQNEQSVELEEAWATYQLSGLGSSGDTFSARFTVGSGTQVQLRKIVARSDSSGRTLTIRPPRARVSLFGLHPNVLAHTVVSVLALSFLLGGPAWVKVLGTLVAYFALFLFGSRTALLAASLALIPIVIAKLRPNRIITIGAIAGLLVVTVLFGLSDSFRRDPDSGVSSRQEIWNVALGGFLGSPIGGISTSFAEFWTTEAPTSPTVAHAHNLWLGVAVQHGVIGLAGAVLATILAAIILWRKHTWNGAALFIALALLNTFDFTLDFPGVYVPLMIAVLIPRTTRQTRT